MTPLAGYGPPEGSPVPFIPAGSSKSTTLALIGSTISDSRRGEHPLPRSVCVAVAAAGKNAHASAAACTGLPPVSLAVIAWSDELTSCPLAGRGSPLGTMVTIPLPSAPKEAEQFHPVGASSFMMSLLSAYTASCPASEVGTATLTDTGSGTLGGGVASANVVGHLTTGRLTVSSTVVTTVVVDVELVVVVEPCDPPVLVAGVVVLGGLWLACGTPWPQPARRAARTTDPPIPHTPRFRTTLCSHRESLGFDHAPLRPYGTRSRVH